MSDTLSDVEVEQRCARLRQYASIAGDFYKALIDQGYPADKAGDLCSIWLDYELGWADE